MSKFLLSVPLFLQVNYKTTKLTTTCHWISTECWDQHLLIDLGDPRTRIYIFKFSALRFLCILMRFRSITSKSAAWANTELSVGNRWHGELNISSAGWHGLVWGQGIFFTTWDVINNSHPDLRMKYRVIVEMEGEWKPPIGTPYPTACGEGRRSVWVGGNQSLFLLCWKYGTELQNERQMILQIFF